LYWYVAAAELAWTYVAVALEFVITSSVTERLAFVIVLFRGEVPGLVTTGMMSPALRVVVLPIAEILVSHQDGRKAKSINKGKSSFFMSSLR
jgi:hypothetical protein